MRSKLTTYLFRSGLWTLLLLCCGSLGAQTEKDLASWSSLEFGYELDSNWKLGLEGQFRLKDDLTAVDEYFGELTLNRKIFKGFQLRVAGRFIRRNDNRGNIQGYENRFRYHFDARYKHKLGALRLNYRLRYQNRNDIGVSKAEGDFPVKRLRLKTGLEYKVKNWPLDPKAAVELFSRFEEGTESDIDKYRLTLGTEYSFKRAGEIEVFWRLERSIDQTIPEQLTIIGLGYKYTLKAR